MSSAGPKLEHLVVDDSPRGSSRSPVSSPEPVPETEDQDPQDPPQTQKRKGGRKPIYATSEERKQRNRQAQAAFRERRTEYIKQLEITIKQNEDNLETLQQNHRAAADECLMLRYKNSLLERVLLEKGIDVQAELQSKTDGPIMRRTNPTVINPPPIQRAMMNRQHNRQQQQQRRFPPGLAPKPDYGFRAGQGIPQNYGTGLGNLGQSTASSFTQQTAGGQPNMASSLDNVQTSQFPSFDHQQTAQPLQPPPISNRPVTNNFVHRMPEYSSHNMLDYASPISGEGDQSPYYSYMDTSHIETASKLNLPFSPYSE